MGTPQLFDEEPTGQPIEDPVEEQEVTENSEEPVADVDESIPEKLRGKSVAEVAQMYTELEKKMGSQGGELGELRKIVDGYIQSQTVAPPVEQTNSEDEELDFYTDPKEAVRKAIDSHPDIQEAKQAAALNKQQAAQAQLKAAHPDYQNIVQDPEFGRWVAGDKELSALFLRADQHYDFSAGNSLLNLWKQRQGAVEQTLAAEKQAQKQSARQASTGNTRAAPQGARAKKVYRRADIIKLIQTDPDRYMAMQPEIMEAYAEGRVK